MGKGSRARPFEIDQEQFATAWERTFGKKDKEVKDIKEEAFEKKTTEPEQSTETK